MPKPNPEQFGRVILWHLAGLRADLVEVKMLLEELRFEMKGPPNEASHEQLKAHYRAVAEKAYIEAVKEAGLEEIPSPPQEDGLDR